MSEFDRASDNIISLSERLKPRSPEVRNSKSRAHRMIWPIVDDMREMGLSSNEMAYTLRFIASILDGKEL
jgi:hypothetical protein